MKFPLATSSWDKAEYEAIQAVIDSDMFTMGPKVAQFEQDFANYLGCRHCVMVNSGSSANLIMIAALRYTRQENLRLNPGDEIIVPAISWSTTYYPLYQYGLKLKFVDVDVDTLNYHLPSLTKAISPNTRAIMCVNILGNPNDFTSISDIIDGKNILLVEDNCESMGATFNGKQAGTFGVVGSFSCFFSHHISTMEGGIIATDDEELYQIMLSLRAHGWTRNLPTDNLVCSTKSDDPFEESFRFILPGYNVRPLEMSGAIGIEQIKKLEGMISARRSNSKFFQDALAENPDIYMQRELGQSSWFGISLVIRPESHIQRSTLREKLCDAGFETRPIVTGDFTKSEVVKYFDYEIFGSMENAKTIDRNGLFIGNHNHDLSEAATVLGEVLWKLK